MFSAIRCDADCANPNVDPSLRSKARGKRSAILDDWPPEGGENKEAVAGGVGGAEGAARNRTAGNLANILIVN